VDLLVEAAASAEEVVAAGPAEVADLVVEVQVEVGKAAEQMVPLWAKAYVPDSVRGKIEQSIQEAEKQTRLEIVVMIARQSSFVGHVFNLLWALLFIAFYLLFSLSYEFLLHDLQSHWSLLISLGLSGVLTWPLSKLNGIKRILCPLQDELRAVSERAELQFYRSDFHKTAGSTGVLIYISLMEKRAILLADPKISSQVSEDFWQSPLRELIAGFKAGAVDKGLKAAIGEIALLGAKHYPAQPENPNEICNRLRFVD